MQTADFDFELPPDLIAQSPAKERDQSRLLTIDRNEKKFEHRAFTDLLALLKSGDVLVLNNSRVIPARLRGTNAKTGGEFEILLLSEEEENVWWAMMRPGKRARVETEIKIFNSERYPTEILATVEEINAEGHRRLRFSGTENILNDLANIGELPLPPYIERDKPGSEDLERYQTVYAQHAGSVAAPTAGLHFTHEILEALKNRGVQICYVTLHVALGTFAPVKAENIAEHIMHEERFNVSDETAQAINQAKQEKRRIIAVGTTSVRVLESAAKSLGTISAGFGKTKIFIYPPYQFKIVDALVTNFHLPRSTLLMLVSAFAAPGEMTGRDLILNAYREAVENRYRFFSYGDAMFIH